MELVRRPLPIEQVHIEKTVAMLPLPLQVAVSRMVNSGFKVVKISYEGLEGRLIESAITLQKFSGQGEPTDESDVEEYAEIQFRQLTNASGKFTFHDSDYNNYRQWGEVLNAIHPEFKIAVLALCKQLVDPQWLIEPGTMYSPRDLSAQSACGPAYIELEEVWNFYEDERKMTISKVKVTYAVKQPTAVAVC